MSGESGVIGVDDFMRNIDVMLQRHTDTAIAVYREMVWNLFVDLLENTPQWTGKAVANWRIGIGAPDETYEANVGDQDELMQTKAGGGSARNTKGRFTGQTGMTIFRGTHQKGDNPWIDYAKTVNKPRLFLIKRLTDAVFITNRVQGDTDNGRSSENYLESLQNPAYWAQKLRDVNKPYETVSETLVKQDLENFKVGVTGEWMGAGA